MKTKPSSGKPLAAQSDEELLQSYLNLSAAERQAHFADTATAAELSGKSQRTIQRWIEEGRVRAVHVVGNYLVLLDSLNSFIQQQLGQPPDQAEE